MSDLTWFGWVFIAVMALNVVTNVLQIGEYRKPLEPSTVLLILIFDALLVWGALSVGTVS